MTAIILDGKKLAEKVKESIVKLVASSVAQNSKKNISQSSTARKPGLGVILVGDNPASKVYVAAKEKFAHECGMQTFDIKLGAGAGHDDVVKAIVQFNNDSSVDGILLQLPLPSGLDQDVLIDLISPQKDADGLHSFNQGLLMRGKGELRSCTPLGSLKLIDLAFSGYADNIENLDYQNMPKADLAGKHALVIGRSILVGKPVSLMLQERNATVTMAHSKTSNLRELCLSADIIVAAIGRANFIPGEWVKKGSVVIDVGINRTAEGKLTGDVDFQSAAGRASFITPVPKGVGPMTIAMLIENTFKSYLKNTEL